MRLYVNESTGYFGTTDPECVLVATLNTILGHGDKEAAKLLGVHRRELYSELFRVSERWEEAVGQDSVYLLEIPQIIERLFDGRVYGIGYFPCYYVGSDKVPEDMAKYFVIEKGALPWPSILCTDAGQHSVISVESDGKVVSQKQKIPSHHAYAYLGHEKRMGIGMSKLVDFDGTMKYARPKDFTTFGGIVIKRNQ